MRRRLAKEVADKLLTRETGGVARAWPPARSEADRAVTMLSTHVYG
jgi:hypothetical protein